MLQELQVLLRPDERLLRVVDPRTGTPVPYLEEAVTRAEQEMQRAEQETR